MKRPRLLRSLVVKPRNLLGYAAMLARNVGGGFASDEERLIFSVRLEVDRLPRSVREQAVASGRADDYTTTRFLYTATEFFEVQAAGSRRSDTLLVLSKRRGRLPV